MPAAIPLLAYAGAAALWGTTVAAVVSLATGVPAVGYPAAKGRP